MSEPSIFTRIINGEIPCHKIYEDDKVIAFLDIHPVNEGHTLVVIKDQVDHIWDLNDADYGYLWNAAKKIALHIRQVTKCQRVAASVIGIDVAHAHIHLVPINQGSDMDKKPDIDAPVDHTALAAMAVKLKM